MGMDQKRTRNAFVGSPVERIEDFRFLRGRGQFVDDLARDDLLHAVILRSSVAHGHIRGIETGAARARPGVCAIITAADIGAAIPRIPLRQESARDFERFEQPLIAHGKVRYVGEPIAVVLAESAGAAEDALDAITLDIETLPAVVDSAAARRNDIRLFEAAGSNLALTLTGLRGDADAAFNGPAYIRRQRVTVQRLVAAVTRLVVPSRRALHGRAPRRRPDGAARAAGGMGCGGRSIDRPRRRQG